jgi:hypothetical protein
MLMKNSYFNTSVVINIPLHQTAALLSNSAYSQHWQPSLKKIEQLKGYLGAENSQTLYGYQFKSKNIQLKASVLKKKLPEFYVVLYEGKGYQFLLKNRLVGSSSLTTTWLLEIEYRATFIHSLCSPRYFSKLKKHIKTFMNNFKQFAELKNQQITPTESKTLAI